MRLDASVNVLTGSEVAAAWARVPEGSRLAYRGPPYPGAVIAGALDHAANPDPDAFAVLRFTVLAIDVLHFGPVHRRARFERADDWAGQWLAP